LLFTTNIAFGNASLLYASIPFVQMVRCTVPIITAGLSYLLLGSTLGLREWASLVPVVAGSIIVSIGEVELSLVGAVVTVVGCFLCAFKAVLTKKLLSGSDKVAPLTMLSNVALFGAVQLWPLVETHENGFLHTFLPKSPAWVLLLLLAHAIQVFMLNIANFEATKQTSALLMTVGGNMKSVLTCGLAMVMFGHPTTTLQVVGILVTVFGVWWYSYERDSFKPRAVVPETQDPGTASDTRQSPVQPEMTPLVTHPAWGHYGGKRWDAALEDDDEVYVIPFKEKCCFVGACLAAALYMLLWNSAWVSDKQPNDVVSENSAGWAYHASGVQSNLIVITVETRSNAMTFPMDGAKSVSFYNVNPGVKFRGLESKIDSYIWWLHNEVQQGRGYRIALIADASDVLYGGCSQQELMQR